MTNPNEVTSKEVFAAAIAFGLTNTRNVNEQILAMRHVLEVFLQSRSAISDAARLQDARHAEMYRAFRSAACSGKQESMDAFIASFEAIAPGTVSLKDCEFDTLMTDAIAAGGGQI